MTIPFLSHHRVLDVRKIDNLAFYFISFGIKNNYIKGSSLNMIVDFMVWDFEVDTMINSEAPGDPGKK